MDDISIMHKKIAEDTIKVYLIAAKKSAPYIGENGNWFVWNVEAGKHIDTGIKAKGESAYEIAKSHGFVGSEEEWLESLKGSFARPTKAFINLLGGADNWVAEEVFDSNNNVIGLRYFQYVHVENADGENIDITPNSKIDLQLSSEQMVVFYEKDLAFVAENEDGAIYIYCIGSVPENDYTIQVTITEVVIDE